MCHIEIQPNDLYIRDVIPECYISYFSFCISQLICSIKLRKIQLRGANMIFTSAELMENKVPCSMDMQSVVSVFRLRTILIRSHSGAGVYLHECNFWKAETQNVFQCVRYVHLPRHSERCVSTWNRQYNRGLLLIFDCHQRESNLRQTILDLSG